MIPHRQSRAPLTLTRPTQAEVTPGLTRFGAITQTTKIRPYTGNHGAYVRSGGESPPPICRWPRTAKLSSLLTPPTGLSNFPFPSLAIDTALAAIPALYTLDRGQ